MKLEVKAGLIPLTTIKFTSDGFEYETKFEPLEDFLEDSIELNAGIPEDVKLEKVTEKNWWLLSNELIKEGYEVKEIEE